MLTLLRENATIALRSIRSQSLRTVLTMLIIAFGIMSLVGMLTAIDVLEQSIHRSFTFMGSNTFIISGSAGKIRVGRHKKKTMPFRPLRYEEVVEFKERFRFPVQISLNAFVTSTASLRHGSRTTTPNVSVTAVDEQYLATAGYEVAEGRNFTAREVRSGAAVCLAGYEVDQQLSTGGRSLLDREILFRGHHLRVVGVLAKSGAGLNTSRDRTLLIPLGFYRQHMASEASSFSVNVKVNRAGLMEPASEEARGLMRSVRRLHPGDSDNFDILRSDSFLRTLAELMGVLSAGAFLIASITLLGALTGLVNIMLVAVRERTREIGVRKAIGARRFHILLQFLLESVIICQLGGLGGILGGLAVGNAVAWLVGGTFVVPWRWIALAVGVCTLTGLAAGVGPALRAARLHPVEALRYE